MAAEAKPAAKEKPAPKVTAKKPRVTAAEKKLAAQWNAIAAADRLPEWSALTVDQRGLLLEMTTDAGREAAVSQLVQQLRGNGTKFSEDKGVLKKAAVFAKLVKLHGGKDEARKAN